MANYRKPYQIINDLIKQTLKDMNFKHGKQEYYDADELIEADFSQQDLEILQAHYQSAKEGIEEQLEDIQKAIDTLDAAEEE